MKTFDINIQVTLAGLSSRDFETAKFISEVIRGKIRRALDSDPQVVKWQIDLPNEQQTGAL